MIFDWYKILNRADFLESGLVSREVTLLLDGVGQAVVLVTRGNCVAITYNGIMLAVELLGDNPFTFDGHAVYVDSNDDIWLGIEADS